MFLAVYDANSEDEVQDLAERVDVAGLGRLVEPALAEFGRHEVPRANRFGRRRLAILVCEEQAEPKVPNDRLIQLTQKDVLRLDVSMNDLPIMCVRDAFTGACKQGRSSESRPLGGNRPSKVADGAILRDKLRPVLLVGARLYESEDSWVFQLLKRLDLPLETELTSGHLEPLQGVLRSVTFPGDYVGVRLTPCGKLTDD